MSSKNGLWVRKYFVNSCLNQDLQDSRMDRIGDAYREDVEDLAQETVP